ncbi:MAG: TIGR00730 family Rossman fold protein [Gammaproteobacteria bacterium]|nr:TIGR00730 family Rossman fold protein [Gammaproteobacteria bacterium]
MKSVCVFTGSNRGVSDAYATFAEQLGQEITNRGMGLVYGASRVGLMGVIADAVLAAGGHVVGVIPEALRKKELMHEGLTETHVVKSMHERKALFAELSDGFVAMPGGLGTLEELFEVLTWAQLGFHNRPVGLLNVSGYYDELLRFLDQTVAQGFVHRKHRSMMLIDEEPAALLDAMADYRPASVSKWIDQADEL